MSHNRVLYHADNNELLRVNLINFSLNIDFSRSQTQKLSNYFAWRSQGYLQVTNHYALSFFHILAFYNTFLENLTENWVSS